jgi:hypothetical protein
VNEDVGTSLDELPDLDDLLEHAGLPDLPGLPDLAGLLDPDRVAEPEPNRVDLDGMRFGDGRETGGNQARSGDVRRGPEGGQPSGTGVGQSDGKKTLWEDLSEKWDKPV